MGNWIRRVPVPPPPHAHDYPYVIPGDVPGIVRVRPKDAWLGSQWRCHCGKTFTLKAPERHSSKYWYWNDDNPEWSQDSGT